MEQSSKRKFLSILSVLQEAGKPLGGTKIAQKLLKAGIDLSYRTIRHYLMRMDKDDLTKSLGKKKG